MNPTQSTFIAWINENQLRKNTAQTILVLIAIVLIGKAILLFRQASHVGKGEMVPQSVYVNGHAEEYVKPDTLVFSVSVSEEGKDVSEATQKANTKVAAAIKVLKSNGVDEKNIKTSYYNVSDRYETVATPCETPAIAPGVRAIMQPCTNSSSKVVGVTLSQSLEVRIQGIDTDASGEKRSKILAELAPTGVKVENFSYSVFDIDAVKDRIRGEAIKDAEKRAGELEKQLGVDFGSVAGFSENTGGYNPVMSARADAMMVEKAAGSAPQVPEGQQKVSVDVSLSYLLK